MTPGMTPGMTPPDPPNPPPEPPAPRPSALPREGPTASLPTTPILGAGMGALAVLGVLATAASLAGAPFTARAVWGGLCAAAVGFLAAIAMLRPWRARTAANLVLTWMATLGAWFLVTVAAAGLLLYSAPPEDRLAAGIAVAAGHFGALMAASVVLARVSKARLDAAAAAAGGSSSRS